MGGSRSVSSTEKCKDHIVCSWGYHHEFGNGDAGRGRQDWNRYCQDVIHGVAKFLLSWRLDVVAFSRSGIGIKDVLSKPWCAIFVYPRSNIRYWTYYMLHYICKLQMIKATELNNVLRPDELPKLPVYMCAPGTRPITIGEWQHVQDGALRLKSRQIQMWRWYDLSYDS